MIKRTYFMSAKCTDSNGYCFRATTGSYTSLLPDVNYVLDKMMKDFREELTKIRPQGKFQVISFNRV